MAEQSARSRATPPPVRSSEPIEWRLALRGVWLAIAVGAVCIAVAASLVGQRGLIGAGVGVAVVAGTLLLSGGLLSGAARFGPHALMAAALGGYMLKLLIYVLLFVLLRDVAAIDGPSLAITAAVLLMVALGWQVRFVLRNDRLFWVAADDRSAAARPTTDVVYPTGRGIPHRSSDSRNTERTSA